MNNEELLEIPTTTDEPNIVTLVSLVLETKSNGELASHFQFDMDLLARSGVNTDKFIAGLDSNLLTKTAEHIFELMADSMGQ